TGHRPSSVRVVSFADHEMAWALAAPYVQSERRHARRQDGTRVARTPSNLSRTSCLALLV
ncbi:MAG: hypothetical protein ACJ79H_15715, partial [Myxococcales bacterium]